MASTSDLGDPSPRSPGYKEMLIKLIKKHPELYDSSFPKYRDPGTTKSAWIKLSDSLKRPVEVVKRDWRGLRDTYWRLMKKSESSTSKSCIKWKYFKPMEFLFPHIKVKSKQLESSDTISRILPDEDDESENGMEQSDLSALREIDEKSPQHVMGYMDHSIIDTDNHPMNINPSFGVPTMYQDPGNESDRLFLLSLIPMLRDLDNRSKSSIKIKIMNMLHQANYPDSEKST
ncbi:hypothetical protein CAPTEDRAFT_190494 [Capitella teleta]|uniref:MADF domain-containing protein n=1 Tax=Capitella teleta TaxID=283909 RepID=R7THN2_CAPTE|nr:hypothetical protein CAPTEDRAFT_190494 [Capitella teleta]|eukprot:ELT92977.1 hypothetical protein CAPTEDRAFT_190494 [Capitella teleta]